MCTHTYTSVEQKQRPVKEENRFENQQRSPREANRNPANIGKLWQSDHNDQVQSDNEDIHPKLSYINFPKKLMK